MENGVDVVMQFITFNPVVVNGVQTFDNMFIVVDASDKMGAGTVCPQMEGQCLSAI